MKHRTLACLAVAGMVVLVGCGDAEQQEAPATETVAQSGIEGGMANPHADIGAAREGVPNPHAAGMEGAGAMGGAGGVANPHTPGAMPGEDGVMNISFKCPDDVDLQLTLYSAEDKAVVTLMGETHELERVRSASGMKFSDGTWSFFSKGPQAMMMKNEEPVVKDCMAAGHP